MTDHALAPPAPWRDPSYRAPQTPRDPKTGRFILTRQCARARRRLKEWKALGGQPAQDARVERAVGGDELLGKARAGTLFPLPVRDVAAARAVIHGAFARSSRRDLRPLKPVEFELIRWYAGARLGHGAELLVLKHYEVSALLRLHGSRCGLTTAGRAVRFLVAAGILVSYPGADVITGTERHVEGPGFYALAPWVLEALDGQVHRLGRKYQPEETTLLPLPDAPPPAVERSSATPSPSDDAASRPPACVVGEDPTADPDPPGEVWRVPAAPERVRRLAALGRIAKRLMKREATFRDGQVTQLEERYATLQRKNWEALAVAASKPGQRSTVMRDVASRGDDRVKALTLDRLVEQGVFGSVDEAATWWVHAAFHQRTCGCAVCCVRWQVAHELRMRGDS